MVGPESAAPTLFVGALLGGACAALIYAAWSDWRHFVIPNLAPLLLVLIWPGYALAAGLAPWPAHLIVFAACFGLGFLAWSSGLIGGGDAKLFAAVGLWAGPQLVAPMALLTVLLGLGLAVIVGLRGLATRPALGPMGAATLNDSMLRRIGRLRGLPLPYGVAIAAAGIWVAIRLGFPV